MSDKIINFNEYTFENTYRTNADGVLEKQDWECVKDFYPEKFLCVNLTKQSEDRIFNTDKFVFIIKYKNEIKAVIENIDDTCISEIFEVFKKTTI